jgi:hypothetical protein
MIKLYFIQIIKLIFIEENFHIHDFQKRLNDEYMFRSINIYFLYLNTRYRNLIFI